jgi:hypothetical protein
VAVGTGVSGTVLVGIGVAVGVGAGLGAVQAVIIILSARARKSRRFIEGPPYNRYKTKTLRAEREIQNTAVLHFIMWNIRCHPNQMELIR